MRARSKKQQVASGAALAATEQWVNFRYEYVSGVGAVFELHESSIEIFVTNRGVAEGVFRAFISQRNVTKFDSGDISVAAGGLSNTGFAPSDAADLGPYWARIFTTSANLVPSMRIWRTQVENEPPISDVYFAPGDFAVFELPWRPFPPISIGPAENA